MSTRKQRRRIQPQSVGSTAKAVTSAKTIRLTHRPVAVTRTHSRGAGRGSAAKRGRAFESRGICPPPEGEPVPRNQKSYCAVYRAYMACHREPRVRESSSAMIFLTKLHHLLIYPSTQLRYFQGQTVSLSLSIYQKACPGCAASVSIGATRCVCGHNFETDDNSLSPLEATLRDEELYEGYLAARAEQARQAVRDAAEALTQEPGNAELVSVAALAREVANSIESDLAEQRNKITAIKDKLRSMEPLVPIFPSAPTTAPVVRKQAESHLPPLTPSAPAQPAPTAAASVTAGVIEKTLPVTVSAKSAPVSSWRATTTQKAAGVLAALKNAKAREAVARAQQTKETVVVEPPSPPAPASTSVSIPPSAFRKEQAAKAEKIMESHKPADGKECPNCTSSVPTNTTRCRCGFAFVSDGTELPSLTLCTGDFTALRNSLKLNLR